jgi:hypothetical protein
MEEDCVESWTGDVETREEQIVFKRRLLNLFVTMRCVLIGASTSN